jgi:HPr kinase/phosphorylase
MLISPTGYVHATAIAILGKGVLIRGKSKAGKSTLAEALIGEAHRAGHKAAFIGDDRVNLRRQDDAILLSPHPEIAGLIERRGVGIARIDHIAEAPLALLVDLELLANTQIQGDEPSINARSFKEIVLGLPILRLKFYHKPAVDHVFPLVLAALAK